MRASPRWTLGKIDEGQHRKWELGLLTGMVFTSLSRIMEPVCLFFLSCLLQSVQHCAKFCSVPGDHDWGEHISGHCSGPCIPNVQEVDVPANSTATGRGVDGAHGRCTCKPGYEPENSVACKG